MNPDPRSPPPASAGDSSDSGESLDERLDEALDETFPASDPVAVHGHRPAPQPTDPAVPTPKEK
jgi:hypothetical protein